MTQQLAAIWRESWRVPDRRKPWLWGEEHIKSIPYSPLPGGFRCDNTPWMREPMEALVDPSIPCVSVMAPIQSGKTLGLEVASCYIIANEPGPVLWLDRDDDDARDQMESRLQKLWAECAPVRDLFHHNKNKTKLSAVHFRHGMSFHCLGAHNKGNLQRRSVRWLIGDETWQWPAGHMAEAEARVTAFGWLGKRFFTSQGGFEGDDTDKKWKSGDQREWYFECPHCGTVQAFDWKNIEWDTTAKDDDGDWIYSRVRKSTVMRCGASHCRETFEDSTRQRNILNKTGRYVAMNPNASGDVVSFHWNSLCSGSWGMLVELYLRAKLSAKAGDLTDLIIFHQKRLAVSWSDNLDDFKFEISPGEFAVGDDWEKEGAFGRDGKIIAAPFEADKRVARLRFMTVDCQLDHFYLVVRSWSASGDSRLVERKRVDTWEDLEAEQAKYGVSSGLVFVDAGHNTYEVYRQCAARGWVALMGDARSTFPHKVRVGRGKNTRQKTIQRYYSVRRTVAPGGRTAVMHFWSNPSIKDCLARLRNNQDPNEGATWEVPADVGDDYLAQMESERRVKKAGRWTWEQIGRRANHYWDCEAMQIVAATMLKLVGKEARGNSEPEPEDGEPSGEGPEV